MCAVVVVVACVCAAAPGGRRPGGLHQQPHGSPHRGTSLTAAHTAHIPPEACDPPRTIIPPLPHTRHLTHLSLHTQGLYEAAYGEGSPLGHSFYASGDSMPAGLVGAFRDKTYTASGMTVVGTGIAHAQLVSWASGLAEAIPKSSPLTTPTSTYFGGEARIKVRPPLPSPLPHISLTAAAPLLLLPLAGVVGPDVREPGAGGARQEPVGGALGAALHLGLGPARRCLGLLHPRPRRCHGCRLPLGGWRPHRQAPQGTHSELGLTHSHRPARW